MSSRKKRGQNDHLRQRNGVWYLRFQYSDALRASARAYYGREDWPKEEARSLNTKDKVEAEVLAQPYIARHKSLLLFHAAASDETKKWGDFIAVWQMEPHTRVNRPDGSSSVASEATIIHTAPDGTITSEPNRRRLVIKFDEKIVAKEPAFIEAKKAVQGVKKTVYKDVDADMMTTYVLASKLSKDDRVLAERGLQKFKLANGGKTIANSLRSDVAKLIEAEFLARGPNGGERIKKMIAYLRAAVNFNIRKADVPLYRSNIFEGHDIDTNNLKRPPYSEADLRLIKQGWALFTNQEKLMVAWHIASSVRPVGLYSIRRDEMTEEEEFDEATGRSLGHHVTRSVMIESDKDTRRGGADYGHRRLPIPQAVLDARCDDGSPLLPDRIDGPLFSAPLDQLLNSINSKLLKIGVNTEDKVDENKRIVEKGKSLYSGRHRARDRFRSIKPPEEMSRAIMGHTRRTSDSHGNYGHGFTMFAMKRVIDLIRF